MSRKNHQVVVFVTEWCPHCKTMRQTSWNDERVVKTMESYHGKKPAYILCNKAQNRILVEEFSIERYPTVVIMDEDHIIKKRAHNMTPGDLLEFLEDFNG
jgi:thiol-disulfide isomerase/thioredoxin|tara:strand:- start:296 stop:595 length:300 start_codon:yes stop_codon:yes gene_type:complete